MTIQLVPSPFWVLNKLHLRLPDGFCELNPNVFSDLDHNDDEKYYVLPAKDYELYQNEIGKTMMMMTQKNIDSIYERCQYPESEDEEEEVGESWDDDDEEFFGESWDIVE